ncbi:leucine-rich repeat domain-containing protein [Capnocytophaga gingivalis]|uniref:leucine-rich repeat domain-containing protein n=1 Tax=Capnocytophaga gingivalis TaxID=1017 RepID=UPI0028F04221|nr:leucine-rich repeat domain-containing protein [Capnocytophaga gingivalis]
MKRIFLTIVAVLGVLAISSCGSNISPNDYELSEDGKTLVKWLNEETVSINMEKDEVLKDVTVIGGAAFEGKKELVSIIFPKELTDIGGFAFKQCSKLESIEIPEGITVIREETFIDCSSLSSVRLPNSLIKIEASAFSYCGELSDLVIPKNVEELGSGCFNPCRKLTTITFEGEKPPFINGAFRGGILRKVYVPKHSVNLYKFSYRDSYFDKIVREKP